MRVAEDYMYTMYMYIVSTLFWSLYEVCTVPSLLSLHVVKDYNVALKMNMPSLT